MAEAGFEEIVVSARGNALTVACYKVNALLLPFIFPATRKLPAKGRKTGPGEHALCRFSCSARELPKCRSRMVRAVMTVSATRCLQTAGIREARQARHVFQMG